MTVLLLRLAGPLQSWGASSRFVRRETRHEPTKSGVVGLLAAAQGRRRSESIEDLAALRFGVRIEQRGTLVRDFQTAQPQVGKPLPLSYRFYLGDAAFVAAVEGDRALLEGLMEAVRAPVFPLFLGRRACPPSGLVALGLREGTVQQALQVEPWRASTWVQKKAQPTVTLDVVRDASTPAEVGEIVRDHPLSFSPLRREYTWRTVVTEQVLVTNEHSTRHGPGRAAPAPAADDLDFFAALGGA